MKTNLKALTCINSLFSHKIKKKFNTLKCALFTRKNVVFFVTCLPAIKIVVIYEQKKKILKSIGSYSTGNYDSCYIPRK